MRVRKDTLLPIIRKTLNDIGDICRNYNMGDFFETFVAENYPDYRR